MGPNPYPNCQVCEYTVSRSDSNTNRKCETVLLILIPCRLPTSHYIIDSKLFELIISLPYLGFCFNLC